MTSAVQHRVRTQDGITLAADCYDHDDARPVVLLLHGGGQNRHAWSASARRLHACGYTVVAYDTRGHGDSIEGQGDGERQELERRNHPSSPGRRSSMNHPASAERPATPAFL